MSKINEYPQAVTINNNDLFVIDQESGGDHATKSASVSQIESKVTAEVSADIGDLSQLTTSDKSSLVGAVNEIASYTPVYGNTASGAIATFDTSLALPLQDCTIAINAVQESGTPTPSSPKLISGFTGANIHVADDENPHVIDNVTAISWQDEAGTVYGGSLDVTSGVLTITHYYWTDDGSKDWHKNPDGSFYCHMNTPNAVHEATGACNYAPYVLSFDGLNVFARSNGLISLGNGWGNIYADVTALKSAFAITPLQIVYPLATPVTYQLTPTQISAIVGTNNVFTDTNGDTSVVYACSLKDYIDRQ